MKHCDFHLLPHLPKVFPGKILVKSTPSQCSFPESDWLAEENGRKEERAALLV